MELSVLEFGQVLSLVFIKSIAYLQCLRGGTFQCSFVLCLAVFINMWSSYLEDDSRVTYLPGYQYQGS